MLTRCMNNILKVFLVSCLAHTVVFSKEGAGTKLLW